MSIILFQDGLDENFLHDKKTHRWLAFIVRFSQLHNGKKAAYLLLLLDAQNNRENLLLAPKILHFYPFMRLVVA